MKAKSKGELIGVEAGEGSELLINVDFLLAWSVTASGVFLVLGEESKRTRDRLGSLSELLEGLEVLAHNLVETGFALLKVGEV